jgi:endoglucanase
MVEAHHEALRFLVRRVRDGSIAFQGNLTAPVDDPDSGDRVATADFSELREQGLFYLDVPGIGTSWHFAIGPKLFEHAYYLATRGYYGQRCGTAVDLAPDFPQYKHAACHLNGAWHPSSGKTGPRVSTHGWHDAGDYGRYVVNSGITTGTLLGAWELYGPQLRRIALHIPESGNGTPDILNEIRWNLDWMLTMQDEDGGVWHKQTSDHFCAFVMPPQDLLTSYVIGTDSTPYKSSCATADFAAVIAIAAREFRPFDSAYADRCLRAAEKAWNWLSKYPDVTFQNPPGVTTGDYSDKDCSDEHLWAAAELWRTTRNKTYEQYFLAHYADSLPTIRPVGPASWSQVGPLALWSYVLGDGSDKSAVAAIRSRSFSAADAIASRTTRSPYRVSLTSSDYIWGSNGVAMNYSLQLLMANKFQANPQYVDAAMDNLHYVLGRNTFSLSFVTQLGDNSVKHIHHRPSASDGLDLPWPGLMAGGPNAGRQDSVMKKLVAAGLPPAKSYVDADGAYACNEIAINWNAPLVFVLAAALAQ